MSHRTLFLLAVLSVAGSAATISHAQNAASAPPSAQSSQDASFASQTAASAPAITKKVWTNDDVSDLRDQSEISIVGAANGKTAKPGVNRTTASKDAKWYHDQIAKLEAQIPPLDRQIADIQSVLDGTPTGDSKTSTRKYGVKGGDWRTEMADLQAKRDDIEAHIGALQDEARHRGIPAEALP